MILACGLENIIFWDQGSLILQYCTLPLTLFLFPYSLSPHSFSLSSPLFPTLDTMLERGRKRNTQFIIIQEKLKGSLPLAAIDMVERLPEDNCSFRITGPFKHPLILQACSREECQEWIKAIENGKTTHKF